DKAKFDETVEAHVRLGIDSKRTELPTNKTQYMGTGSQQLVLNVFFSYRTRSFASPRQNLPNSSNHRIPTKHDNKSCIPRSN
ncbi:hypothetical protein S83_055281, partial [Arachis hypogaea]